jgi:hypothetical protein
MKKLTFLNTTFEKLSEPDSQVKEEVKQLEPESQVPKMSDDEINKKIDDILNDQSLTSEEAQRQVAQLEAQLAGKSTKKPLF